MEAPVTVRVATASRSGWAVRDGRRWLVALAAFMAVTCEGGVLPRPPSSSSSASGLGPYSGGEPPVTSNDLPKQIPAPPGRPRQPHFASTPHYDQQLPRFIWVAPQYNTPSYPAVLPDSATLRY